MKVHKQIGSCHLLVNYTFLLKNIKNLQSINNGNVFTKGTRNKLTDGRIMEAAKKINFLEEFFIKFMENPGPDVIHARVIPAALALHSKDIT